MIPLENQTLGTSLLKIQLTHLIIDFLSKFNKTFNTKNKLFKKNSLTTNVLMESL